MPYNIHEKHIKKDSWVKDIRKTFNPELLADLIRKRIEFPGSTGPFVSSQTKDEDPTDIIDAFIADSEEYRNKLTPAVGLLLYRMLHGKLGESHEILRGVFSIIRTSKLIECNQLVYNWLQKKNNAFTSNDPKWKHTYRDGMMAYAQIQSVKNKEIEDWWHSVWKEGSSVWWSAAFMGLQMQNPDVACAELPVLMERYPEKISYILFEMWNNTECRSKMEIAIKRGLDENTGWAGLALNILLGKLTEADKNKLMLSLKELTKSN
jgi:hypothetical protein